MYWTLVNLSILMCTSAQKELHNALYRILESIFARYFHWKFSSFGYI